MLRNLLRKRRDRLIAQNRYFDNDLQAGRILDKLSETDDPRDRAALLHKLARLAFERADAARGGWGDDRAWQDEADEGMLYRLLADVEMAVGYRDRRRCDTTTPLERQAGDILDRMALTPDLAARHALLDDLYDAVVDEVGGQAAEVIACLPWPGTTNPARVRGLVAGIRSARAVRKG